MVLLFTLSVIQYSIVVRNDFVWDAKTIILEDPTIRDFSNIGSFFVKDYYNYISQEGSAIKDLKYYRPVVKILLALEYRMFGPRPYGYNAVNIILNAFVVVLCFAFVMTITGDKQLAFLSTVLYSVNPARVEVVSWVYSFSYIVTAFFSMLSLVLYVRKKYLISIVFFILALFSQEGSVMLPAIIIIYEYCIANEEPYRKYLKVSPYLIAMSAYIVIRRTAAGALQLTNLDYLTLFNTDAVILKKYIKMSFLPDAAITIYQKEFFHSLDREVLFSYAVISLLVLLGIVFFKKSRHYLFWYLWFFVWIIPIFNAGAVGEYLLNEKMIYLAVLGLCICITGFVMMASRSRLTVAGLFLCLICFHFTVTFHRNLYWKDSFTYLKKSFEFAPNFYLSHYALATEYVSRGDYLNALEEYRKTIALNPVYSYAHNNMGNVYLVLGDMDNAARSYEKTIEIDPVNPQPYYNLGLIAEKKERLGHALEHYRKYLSLVPQPESRILEHIRAVELKNREIM